MVCYGNAPVGLIPPLHPDIPPVTILQLVKGSIALTDCSSSTAFSVDCGGWRATTETSGDQRLELFQEDLDILHPPPGVKGRSGLIQNTLDRIQVYIHTGASNTPQTWVQGSGAWQGIRRVHLVPRRGVSPPPSPRGSRISGKVQEKLMCTFLG